jgi:predicted CXXCH cytochrome family protein
LGLLFLVAGGLFADWWQAYPIDTPRTYIGKNRCLECHQQQVHDWEDSHHALAMQLATPETVLADFDNAELKYHGITARMFRRGEQFFVHTEGPDGEMADFEVKYVFGVDPLQQYMVEVQRGDDLLPHEIGQVQVLRESWDTHRKRWFYLPPPDVHEKLEPDDELHWTGMGQRWNFMCADCHSTNLQKNFDPETATYRTTFSEINISCEACHGPGSLHVELAHSYSFFWDRNHGYGLNQLKGDNPELEIQTCAPCHARRRVLYPGYEPGKPYYDYFTTEPPTPLTYFPDGQILDEVYEHGSFMQSKMYHEKIRCSDCHDPHTARLKAPGNQVCTSCHQHPAGRYDTPAHHQHRPGSAGASCVGCHMGQNIYMEVDARHDHSLRVPRPDLSVRRGTPNTCTQCHLDRADFKEKPPERELPAGHRPYESWQYSDWVIAAREDEEVRERLREVDEWALRHVQQWYPESDRSSGRPHFSELLTQTWENDENSSAAARRLVESGRVHPAIIRAAALDWMQSQPDETTVRAALRSLADPDPLVRAAAVRTLEGLIPGREEFQDWPREARQAVLGPLHEPLRGAVDALEDARRLVRTEAARVLSLLPADLLGSFTSGPERARFRDVLDEIRTGLSATSDRAGSHLALGSLEERLGNLPAAESAYRTAIRVEPGATGPRTNLAALLEQRLAQTPAGSAAAQAELQTEIQQLRQDELTLLTRDARLAPDHADIQYRLGLSRYLNNDLEGALSAVRRAQELEAENPTFLLMLALLHQRLENFAEAERHAVELIRLVPNNPGYQQLLRDIRQQRSQSPE